ncbi:MAG TPA: MFS transporter [Mycobacteriales bacterium]|nr:MFS transporter [Mycobacteriales bacterium]
MPRAVVVLPIVLGTLTCTLSNNIVNVPLNQIMRDLRVPLSRGALVVVAFGLATAVMMPIAGWLADRFGRRRVYLSAVALIGLTSCGASLAPTLPVLVMFRVLQALAAASTLPAAMGILTELYGIEERGRGLGLWAAANGLGQAVGPPVGGLITGWLSWRWIFMPTISLSVVAFGLAALVVPRDRGQSARLDWLGASTLTGGAGLLVAAVTIVPQVGVDSPAVFALAAGGIVVLAGFARTLRTHREPFVNPGLFREPSYLRSTFGVFTQMFCLGGMLLAVPLYLIKGLHHSTTTAGLVVFALPAAMTVLAPAAGRAARGTRTRHALRAGLLVLAAGQVLLAVLLGTWAHTTAGIAMALVVAGIGTAFVQAPAATGATRSALGRGGTGLGLFNLVRFAGSALGAAWGAIALSGGRHYGLVFVVCAVVAVIGLAGTLTRAPAPTPVAAGR